MGIFARKFSADQNYATRKKQVGVNPQEQTPAPQQKSGTDKPLSDLTLTLG
jgi:hypothetical protein